MIYRKQWVIPLCWSVLCNPKDGTSVYYGSEWAVKSKGAYGVIHRVLKFDDFKSGFPKFNFRMQKNIFCKYKHCCENMQNSCYCMFHLKY